jgi:hypothetical protein
MCASCDSVITKSGKDISWVADDKTALNQRVCLGVTQVYRSHIPVVIPPSTVEKLIFTQLFKKFTVFYHLVKSIPTDHEAAHFVIVSGLLSFHVS